MLLSDRFDGQREPGTSPFAPDEPAAGKLRDVSLIQAAETAIYLKMIWSVHIGLQYDLAIRLTLPNI